MYPANDLVCLQQRQETFDAPLLDVQLSLFFVMRLCADDVPGHSELLNWFVWFIWFVWYFEGKQQNKQDQPNELNKPNRPNKPDQPTRRWAAAIPVLIRLFSFIWLVWFV
jgi:hypothetical protein